MKKQTVNYSWPAILSDFSKDEVQGNFTRGNLKVFFIGETADHRKFSKEFADNLIKTLPYTPVVSRYDEEEDDFVGHAPEQQIFGIVDPCIEPRYEEDEDGKVWAVCGVVFYTERPDKVGEIAKKIAGHQHSLELNPNTVKYVVNYDEKRHFKNIEFTAGDFVGVSVLGKKQKPAFTGSEFFEDNSEFNNKMEILRKYVEAGKEEINNPIQNGGQDMDFNQFMKLSYGEISLKVEEAICKEYENDAFTFLVDFYEDSAIVRFFYYIENCSKLMRIKYSCDENGNVTLGGINEVHISYEDIVTDVPTTSSEDGEFKAAETEEEEPKKGEDNNVEEDKKDEEKPEDCAVDEVTEAKCGDPEDKDDESEDKDDEDKVEDAACGDGEKKKKAKCEETGAENVEDQTANTEETFESETTETPIVEQPTENESTPDNFSEGSVELNEKSIQEDDSSASILFESQRQELENLKREKKVALVNEYKEYLTEDEFNNFTSNIDSFEEKDLTIELLMKYKESASKSIEKPVRMFAYKNSYSDSEVKTSDLDALVKKYKK